MRWLLENSLFLGVFAMLPFYRATTRAALDASGGLPTGTGKFGFLMLFPRAP
jgi:hypothetical protein